MFQDEDLGGMLWISFYVPFDNGVGPHDWRTGLGNVIPVDPWDRSRVGGPSQVVGYDPRESSWKWGSDPLTSWDEPPYVPKTTNFDKEWCGSICHRVTQYWAIATWVFLPWATTATSHILAGYPHASMGNPKRPFPAKALHHAALVPRPEAGRQLCDRTPLQTEISDTRTHKDFWWIRYTCYIILHVFYHFFHRG